MIEMSWAHSEGDTKLEVFVDGKPVPCSTVRILLTQDEATQEIRAGISEEGGLWLSEEIKGKDGNVIMTHERG